MTFKHTAFNIENLKKYTKSYEKYVDCYTQFGYEKASNTFKHCIYYVYYDNYICRYTHITLPTKFMTLYTHNLDTLYFNSIFHNFNLDNIIIEICIYNIIFYNIKCYKMDILKLDGRITIYNINTHINKLLIDCICIVELPIYINNLYCDCTYLEEKYINNSLMLPPYTLLYCMSLHNNTYKYNINIITN
jgi:hypothetical protein